MCGAITTSFILLHTLLNTAHILYRVLSSTLCEVLGTIQKACVDVACLVQYMGFASYDADETIFKQGDMGEHFYIILSGAVSVSVHDDDPEKVTAVVLSQQMLPPDRLMHTKLMPTVLVHPPSCAQQPALVHAIKHTYILHSF